MLFNGEEVLITDEFRMSLSEPSAHGDEIGYQALHLVKCGTPSYRSTTNFTPWCGETEIDQNLPNIFTLFGIKPRWSAENPCMLTTVL